MLPIEGVIGMNGCSYCSSDITIGLCSSVNPGYGTDLAKKVI